jgi:L-asparagine transporter-like permease
MLEAWKLMLLCLFLGLEDMVCLGMSVLLSYALVGIVVGVIMHLYHYMVVPRFF